MDKNKIGERIKYERQRLDLSQLELGKLIGVSKQCISGWETGRTTPDSITLNKIAKIFNLDVNYFLEENICDINYAKKSCEKYPNLTKKELQIISKLRSMPAKRRQAFEILLDIRDENTVN